MVKKSCDYAAKDDVKEIVTQAVDTIMVGMETLATKEDIKRLEGMIEVVENKADKLTGEVVYKKDLKKLFMNYA